jgi:hypothetical protein
MSKACWSALFCLSLLAIPAIAHGQEDNCAVSRAQAAELRRKIDLGEAMLSQSRKPPSALFVQSLQSKHAIMRAEAEQLERCRPIQQSTPQPEAQERSDVEAPEPHNTYHPFVKLPVVISGTDEILVPVVEHYESKRDGKLYILTSPNTAVDPRTGTSISVASKPEPAQTIEPPSQSVPAAAALPRPTPPASAAAATPAALAMKPRTRTTRRATNKVDPDQVPGLW